MVSSSERQPNAHFPVDPPVRFVEDSSGERFLTAPHPVTVMRCPRCGAADAGTAARCRRCGNDVLDRIEVSGRGRLVSWTVVRRPAGAFAHRDAFAVALVDLDAGPRLTGNLEGWEREPPLGAAVRVTGEIGGIPLFAVEDSLEDRSTAAPFSISSFGIR